MTKRSRHGSAAYDRLLDAPEDGGTRLAELLAAARAPAQPSELGGLVAARSAFERAQLGPARGRAAVSVPSLGRAAGRVVAVKVIALLGGASVLGGAAYAAADVGLLPGINQQPAHHAPATPASSHESAPGGAHRPAGGGPIPGATSVTVPGGGHSHTPAHPATSTAAHASPSPSAQQPSAQQPSAPQSSPHPTHPTHPPKPTPSEQPTPTKTHPSHGGNPSHARDKSTPSGYTKSGIARPPHPRQGAVA
jgi:hypothetical protein